MQVGLARLARSVAARSCGRPLPGPRDNRGVPKVRPTFASASVFGEPLAAALDGASARVRAALGGRVDAALLFLSTSYGDDAAYAGRRVRRALRAPHLVGCTAAGVCGSDGESESVQGVSILGVQGDPLRFDPFAFEPRATAAEGGSLRFLARRRRAPVFVTLSDPFSVDPDRMVRRFEATFPRARVVGGLASGGARPGSHWLYCNDSVSNAGCVGMVVTGVGVRTVVSQGCRPVGRRFVVTKMKDGRVLGLSGEPALDVIQRELASLPDGDRELARRHLLVGRVAHEARDDFRRGDFLVRNLLGVVPEEKAIVVGDRLRLGQTLQLQLRDRAAAEEDLDVLLAAARAKGPVGAALLFTCAGRGQALFGRRSADVEAVRRRFGDVPLAGFACAGELGPVGGRSFLHGFTASVALLEGKAVPA